MRCTLGCEQSSVCIQRQPDIQNARHWVVLQMLSYGCTRLEIGLQSIYEDVARDTNRGHTVAAVGECFRLAKDAGFKVGTACLQTPLYQGCEIAILACKPQVLIFLALMPDVA